MFGIVEIEKIIARMTTICLALFAFSFSPAQAAWVNDDQGNPHRWEPPAPLKTPSAESTGTRSRSRSSTTVSKAQVLFALDTSGSMDDEFAVLCDKIGKVVSGLVLENIDISYQILGISENYRCTTDTVKALASRNGGSTVNHEEDWGPAIVDLSRRNPWESGRVRVVVTLSDEGTQNGGNPSDVDKFGGTWDDADEQAVVSAIEAALENQVVIIPILCSGWYDQMQEAAQRMAEATHGAFFYSDAPEEDLVDGLVAVIGNAMQSVETKGVSLNCHLDDAWKNPNGTKISKLPGDLVTLSCRVKNDSEYDVRAKLTFDYPDQWRPVLDDLSAAVKTREAMWGDEQAVPADNVSSEQGLASVSGMEAEPGSVSQWTLLRLAVPLDTPTADYSFEFKLENDGGQNFADKNVKIEKKLRVHPHFRKIVLTNRRLLYKRYATLANDDGTSGETSFDPEAAQQIDEALDAICQLASDSGAYVMCVDLWDLYDDFSGLNPDCGLVGNSAYCADSGPLAYWDRKTYYDCNFSNDENGENSQAQYSCSEYKITLETDKDERLATEEKLNKVSTAIDAYSRYWIDRTGGESQKHWMFIVGDDQVIPFYRAFDPTFIKLEMPGLPTIAGSETLSSKTSYKSSDHTLAMAEFNWIFTDSIYQDVDGSGWGEGDVDDMYVGRLVGEGPKSIASYLARFTRERNPDICTMQGVITAEDATLSSGKPNNGEKCSDENDKFRNWIMEGYDDFQSSGFTIRCQSDGNCGQDCRDGNWNDGCLLGRQEIDSWLTRCLPGKTWGFDDYVVSDCNAIKAHGSIFTSGGIRSDYLSNWAGHENLPAFFLFSCLSGLADFNDDYTYKHDQPILTVALLDKGFSSVIAGTALTTVGGKDFYNNFVEKLTGKNRSEPSTIGEALNYGKRKYDPWSRLGKLSNFAYTLYGIPWLVYKNPNQVVESGRSRSSSAKSGISRTISIASPSKRSMQEEADTQKYVQTLNLLISDGDYMIAETDGFEELRIDGYDLLDQDQYPVLPCRRVEVDIPAATENVTLSVAASVPVDLGEVPVPWFNDYPPLDGVDSPDMYTEAPEGAEFFDPVGCPIWFVVHEIGKKTVVLDLVPATFDPVSSQVVLYTELEIRIEYETAQTGVLQEAAAELREVNAGESFSGTVGVENTSAAESSYAIQASVKNGLGEEVQKQETSLALASGETGTANLEFDPVSDPDFYFVDFSVSDGSGEIGASRSQVRVESGRISHFQHPSSADPGETVDFSLSFQNLSKSSMEVKFELLFYRDGTYSGNSVPVVSDVEASNEETLSFQWAIPDDAAGRYSVVAKALFGEDGAKAEGEILVGRSDIALNPGWNLVSLDRHSENVAIEEILGYIMDEIICVYSFENGTWLRFDPANPQSSELDSMQEGKGYWIETAQAAVLTVFGTKAVGPVDLVEGWNLVGYNGDAEMSVSQALVSVEGCVLSAWTMRKDTWLSHHPETPGFDSLQSMSPKEGYWIEANQECSWKLPD